MKYSDRMKNIVDARMKSDGVKQGYLAERCGFTQKQFSDMLHGRKNITCEVIEMFCAGMGIEPNDLFDPA